MKNASNTLMLRKLVIVAVLMFGFGFALIPFYKKICEVTGINQQRTTVLPQANAVDATRWVTVQFLANTSDLPWNFKPLQNSVRVRPGQLTQIAYQAANTTDQQITGRAIPSYGPEGVGQYLKKIQCFCFNEQTLKAHEVKQMPVQFVVSNDLPKGITTITLSYTFYDAVAGS